MESIRFEELTAERLPEVMEIYNYYILNTTATFHTRALTQEQMKEVVFFANPRYKTFAIISGGRLCGYVILSQHKKREAYDGTAEISIYLRQEYAGKGIGSQAVRFIEHYAREQGIHVLIATICGANNRSIRSMEKNGFEKCAHYKEMGRKMGQLLNIVAYQKILR
jgi:phosphinothricin acetyltransferase